MIPINADSKNSAKDPAPAQPVVRVDDEPLHKQRWKSDDVRLVDVQFPPQTTSLWHQHVHYGVYICITPIHATEKAVGSTESKQLAKQRGDVFCRDHVKDHLIHVVSTTEDPMRIIEVELLKDARHLLQDAVLPLHVHRSIVLVHDDDRCRVYRITLLPGAASDISLILPTNGVLVALYDCTVLICNPSVDDKIHADHTRSIDAKQHKFDAGDDAQLVAGKFALHATEFGPTGIAAFILTEVY